MCNGSFLLVIAFRLRLFEILLETIHLFLNVLRPGCQLIAGILEHLFLVRSRRSRRFQLFLLDRHAVLVIDRANDRLQRAGRSRTRVVRSPEILQVRDDLFDQSRSLGALFQTARTCFQSLKKGHILIREGINEPGQFEGPRIRHLLSLVESVRQRLD